MKLYTTLAHLTVLVPLSLGLASAQAEMAEKSTTTTTTTVITTEVPAPQEIVVEPAGYVSCRTVAAGWEGKIWHPEYKVCQYDAETTTVKGEEWVAGHWQCSEYTLESAQSECTGWNWNEGHWLKTYSATQ